MRFHSKEEEQHEKLWNEISVNQEGNQWLTESNTESQMKWIRSEEKPIDLASQIPWMAVLVTE